MGRGCAAIGCTNRNANHVFPKDPERRYKWVRALKREKFTPSDYTAICSEHFLPTDYKNDEFGYLRRNLKDDAVPSVFPALIPQQLKPATKRRLILVRNTPPTVMTRAKVQILQVDQKEQNLQVQRDLDNAVIMEDCSKKRIEKGISREVTRLPPSVPLPQHNDLPQQMRQSNTSNYKKCNKCDWGTHLPAEMDKHIRRVHKLISNPYKCPKCPYEYSAERLLKWHMEETHNTILSSNDSNKRSKVKLSPPLINLEAEEVEEDKTMSERAYADSDDIEHAREKGKEDGHVDVDKPSVCPKEDYESDNADDFIKQEDKHEYVDNSSSYFIGGGENPSTPMELDPTEPSDISTPKEELCLRWKNFEADLSQSFAGIRDQSQFFDCTLVTDEGAILRAHKVILAACSGFFRNILTKEIIEVHPNPLVYLQGVSATNMKSVLDFMYHGEVNVAKEELREFLKVAETLKIRGLMDGPNVPSAINKQNPLSEPINLKSIRAFRTKRRPETFLSSDDSNKRPKVKLSPLNTDVEAEEIEDDKTMSERAYSVFMSTFPL